MSSIRKISPIAIDSTERVYVVNFNGVLSVIDATGALVWSFQLPSLRGGGGMVLGPDGTVYVGTSATSPEGFDAEHMFAVRQGQGAIGQLVWQANLHYTVTATPALSAGGTLYVSDACSKLHALDPTTGAERWAVAVPNLAADKCAEFAAPALAPDGTIYVSTEGPIGMMGGVLAIRGDGTGPAATAWPVESANAAHTGEVAQ